MSLAADYDALRRTVYGEARGQSFLGQVAVAHVILNRANHPTKRWWGTGIVGVCFAPKQFSCWNEGDPNEPLARNANESLPSFCKASTAAAVALTGIHPDPTGGSDHYHTIGAPPGSGQKWPPKWAKDMRETARIGEHVFYKAP